MSEREQEFDFIGEGDLPDAAKAELRDVLDDFFDRPLEKADDFGWEAFKRNEPFKAIMMPSRPFWVIADFERSFTQKLGQQMYERFARAVADANTDVGDAERGHNIEDARISPEQRAVIEDVIQGLKDGNDPDWATERERVATAGGEPTIDLGDPTWDLRVGAFRDDRPLYAEIKSPKPNKDQALAAKRAMLQTVAAYAHRDEPAPVVRFALPFNPYGSRDAYDHWPAKRAFDIADSEAVLVAEEFWDVVGGPGTMDGLCQFLLAESEDNLANLQRIAAGDRDADDEV